MPKEKRQHMEDMITQCLFCVTGQEEKVVQAVHTRTESTAIFPKKLKPIWTKDGWKEIYVPLLPGYVFVYGSEPITWSTLWGERHLIRILSYEKRGAEHSILSGQDRDFARMLLEKDGKLGALAAIEEGDRVKIIDGFLNDYQGNVVKVDKRKRLAKVELSLLGGVRSVWLAFSMMEREEETEDIAPQ